MSATRFNDAVLALIAAYQGATAIGGAGVPVYDGPHVMTAEDLDFIVVGHDGSLAADGSLSPNPVAGTFVQSNLEDPGVRQETGLVNCVIVSWTGDVTDLAGRRQRASDLLQAAEDAVAARGGYTGTGIMFDGTSDGRWPYRQTDNGVVVLAVYRVSYSTGW